MLMHADAYAKHVTKVYDQCACLLFSTIITNTKNFDKKND